MSDKNENIETPSERAPAVERPAAFTGTSEGKETPLVPKNLQRLATRTLVLLLAVAGIILGLQKWRSLGGDIEGVGGADTKGNILALQLLEEGSRAVVVRDGAIVESAGYSPGASDRDAVWNPSGNRAFFVSDRKDGATHIYRWNPAKGSAPDQRTVDESSRGEIAFPRETSEKADESALVATRGNIEEFFPGETRSQRILPPITKDIAQGTGDEPGSQGSFDVFYKLFGTSFRTGRWCRGKTLVAAIMRRENGGEVLIIQSLVPDAKGATPRPVPVVAGERITIDVNPVSGDLVASVSVFDYPTEADIRAATRNGKVQRPYRHLLGLVDLSNPGRPSVIPVAASQTDDQTYGAPVFSPDGTKILVTVGKWVESSLRPESLVLFSPQPGNGPPFQGVALMNGEIFEPSWSPEGDRIVYIRRESGRRAIFVAASDGSGETSITGDKGDFASPRFSPQM